MGSAVCPQDPDILQGRPPDEALMGLGHTGHVHEANSLSQRGHLREREASLCQGFPCPVSKEGRRLRAARPLQTCRPDAVIAGTPAPPWCHTLSHKTWRKWHMPCMAGLGQGGFLIARGHRAAHGTCWNSKSSVFHSHSCPGREPGLSEFTQILTEEETGSGRVRKPQRVGKAGLSPGSSCRHSPFLQSPQSTVARPKGHGYGGEQG